MTVQMWKTLEITAKKEKSLIPPLFAVQWMIYTSELLCNYSFWSLSWQRSYIFVVCQLFDLVYEWQPIRSKWWKWAETIFKRISLLIIQFSLGHWDNKNAGMCFALSYESPRKTTRSYRGARISLFPFIICRIVGAETVSLSQWGEKAGQQSILELTQKRAIHTYRTSFHIISMCLHCRRKPLRQNTQTQETKAWAGWGSQTHEYFIVMTTDAGCSLAMLTLIISWYDHSAMWPDSNISPWAKPDSSRCRCMWFYEILMTSVSYNLFMYLPFVL